MQLDIMKHIPGATFQVALWFLVFTTLTQALPQRDEAYREQYNFYNGTVWNETLQKTEKNCANFHDPSFPGGFFYWPEDKLSPPFHYCCGLNVTAFEDYKYGNSSQLHLLHSVYIDVGLIDDCLPFWGCLGIHRKMLDAVIWRTFCETSDLGRFYKYRFWRLAVGKHGLLQTALPSILLLELMVALVAILWTWRCVKSAEMPTSLWEKLLSISKIWFPFIRKRLLMDWAHLCLMSINGNSLIEAIVHQSLYLQQSRWFYSYSILYIFLMVILWLSSFVQQLAYWIAVERIMRPAPVVQLQTNEMTHDAENQISKHCLKVDPNMAQLRALFPIDDNYKWQPIVIQAAILFCLWGFLTYTSLANMENSSDIPGMMLGFIVQAGAPWTALYAFIIGFRRLRYIYDPSIHTETYTRRPTLQTPSVQSARSLQTRIRSSLQQNRTGFTKIIGVEEPDHSDQHFMQVSNFHGTGS